MTDHHRSHHGRTSLLIALVAAFAVFAPATARAQATGSAKTAAEHATLASKAADLATAKKHMHHALNCLEGKSGKDYDASAGDPCKGVGTSYPAGSANDKKVQEAIRILNVGETLETMAASKHIAEAAAAVLEDIKG